MKVEFFGHPDDKPLRCSLNEFKIFQESAGWLDVCDWITESIEFHKEKLLKANNMEEVRMHQAAVMQLENIKELPDLFIKELEVTQKQQE